MSRAMFGGAGRGGGVGNGIEGIPSAAADLDAQLGSSQGGSARAKGGKKGFEIAGPLNNRPIKPNIEIELHPGDKLLFGQSVMFRVRNLAH